jgi:hypothetical protein
MNSNEMAHAQQRLIFFLKEKKLMFFSNYFVIYI